MKNKKTYYALLMAGIAAFTILVPFLIKASSGAFIKAFAPGSIEDAKKDETESEGTYTLWGYEQTEADESIPKQDEASLIDPEEKTETDENTDLALDREDPRKDDLQKRKEEEDDRRSSYVQSQRAELSESRSGMLEIFALDGGDALSRAVADHLYSAYGDLYEIRRIDVVDFISETKEEITCQIKVVAAIGEKEYEEYFFTTYNRTYDFYSVYAYHE